MSSSVQRILSSPASVGQILNWSMNLSRNILAVHISGKAIDVALLSHPGQNDYPVRSLPPLSLSGQVSEESDTKPQFLEQLSHIVAANRVCGLVVSYNDHSPSKSVLDTLNKILQDNNIVASNRPACVWDAQTDSVGSVPARDKEQSRKQQRRSFSTQPALESNFEDNASPSDEGMLAAAVASSYLRTHWPDLAPKLVHQTTGSQTEHVQQYKEEPEENFFLGGLTEGRFQGDEDGNIDEIRETFVSVPRSETTQPFVHRYDWSTTMVDTMLRKQPEQVGAAQAPLNSAFGEDAEIKEELLPQNHLRELVREAW